MILAAKSTYTSFSGSNIVLRCNIIDQGVPPAVFSWRKNGYRLNGDYVILIDNNVMEIKLMNLTFENAGVYTCAADGLLSDRSDSIELTVESKSVAVIFLVMFTIKRTSICMHEYIIKYVYKYIYVHN